MSDTPVNVGDVEWLHFRFRDLDDDELFWFKNNYSSTNKAFRKINNTTALDIGAQNQFEVEPTTLVYQKEY